MSIWSESPDLDDALIRLVEDNPTISGTELADLLAGQADAPITKDQAQKRRLLLVGHAPRPVPVTPSSVPTEQGGDISRVRSGPSVDYLPAMGRPLKRDGRLVVCAGDTQFPFEAPLAWAGFLSFVRSEQPDEIVLTGDVMDSTTISRWDTDPRSMQIQDEMTYTYDRLLELRRAMGPYVPARIDPLVNPLVSLPARKKITYVCGNHDDRLAKYIAKQVANLVGLRRAGEEVQVLTLPYLLNLDALNIDWVGAKPGVLGGDYINAVYRIAPDLVATHGYYSRKGGGGASILPLVDSWDCSVVGGHDHRQGIGTVTRGGVAGSEVRYLSAISTGSLCARDLGYLPVGTSNWQPGWAGSEVYDDGTWPADLATVRGSTVVYRGRRWEVKEPKRKSGTLIGSSALSVA